jgi:hypothetical protein
LSDFVYVYVVPWSEFPILPYYPHYPQEGEGKRERASEREREREREREGGEGERGGRDNKGPPFGIFMV